MLRYRRYRVFIIIAIFAIGALYHFSTFRSWDRNTRQTSSRLQSEDSQKDAAEAKEEVGATKGPPILKIEQTSGQESTTATTTLTTSALTPSTRSSTSAPAASRDNAAPQVTGSSSEGGASKSSVEALVTDSIAASTTSTATPSSTAAKGGSFGLGGQGRHEVPPPLSSGTPIYWTRLPEHFPVPSDLVIPVPTGKAKSIPKIQFQFKDETSAAKIEREKKRNVIKEAFKHAWSGYRQYAWLHDEVKPVSGGRRDPFCGWAATLVDALDTLAIMGLDEEFAEATEALSQIEFTTSPRPDIPLFETTIRYLGGLLAAHDLSQGKYAIILEKAKELADILMGAFDTPNRMPIMYYFWRPTFASNPHRAGTRAVLAELGSLSMEFTRLAQITEEDKYYDAVARITKELHIYQSQTKVPGLWPKYIDTSGCKKPEAPIQQPGKAEQIPVIADPRSGEASTGGTSESRRSRVDDWPERTLADIGTQAAADDKQLQKRQLDMDQASEQPHAAGLDPSEHNHVPADKVDCQPQGLTSPPNVRTEHFTFGGAADSTYEYLPKQYLLLGGQAPEYREMYESAIDAANKHLLFRPMIPEEDREILVVGSADVKEKWTQEPENFKLVPDQSHLLCFTGGMWGIGSKIFGREADMEIAEKLTDGCVWAYEATATGIMPESMSMMPCDNRTSCAWNQTHWYSALDPFREQREDSQRRMKQNELAIEAQKELAAGIAKNQKETELEGASGLQEAPASEEIPTSGPIAKRQLESSEQSERSESSNESKNSEPSGDSEESQTSKESEKTELSKNDEKNKATPPVAGKAHLGTPSAVDQEPPLPSETVNMYPTHEEYVESRIKRERLPIGVPLVRSKDYILRPEAIESVFIMYRLTGDEKWREKGWMMFESIQNATLTDHGHSAIKDVMRPGWESNHKDQMESFWLAETLKYFYLLFSPPTHISLDDYVL